MFIPFLILFALILLFNYNIRTLMACSRYNNDRGRIEKQNAILTHPGRYALDAPGPGDQMAFNADPHIRIQKWGANFRDNMMDINSDLRGMTRPLTRDIPEVNDYKQWSVKPSVAFTPEETNYVTDDSRSTHPAWTYREAEINRFEPTLLNPLDQLEKPFHYDLNTRILERDNFKPTPVKLAIAGQGYAGQGYAPFIKTGKIGSSLQ
jgi:hypothetical protein